MKQQKQKDITQNILEKVTDHLCQKYKHLGNPYEDNMALGLKYDEEFTQDEQKSLKESLSAIGSQTITIRQYYDHFNILPEHSQIIKKIQQVNPNKDYIEWEHVNVSLPTGTIHSIDTYLEHMIPKQMIDITEKKINKLKEGIYKHYLKRYNNPMGLYNTFERRAKRLWDKISYAVQDSLFFFFSGFTKIIVREPEEDYIKKGLLIGLGRAMSDLENDIQIPEVLLATYFKFEKKLQREDEEYKLQKASNHQIQAF